MERKWKDKEKKKNPGASLLAPNFMASDKKKKVIDRIVICKEHETKVIDRIVFETRMRQKRKVM